MAMNLYELPYQEFLNLGSAWSPSWTNRKQGFGWTLVFAPPGLSEIPSESVYYFLLTRRIEWHLVDWIENYVSEMVVDDLEQVYAATIRLICQTVPVDLATTITPEQSINKTASILSNHLQQEFPDRVFPYGKVPFPVPLLGREESADFANCICQEVTLQGWLTEAFD